VAAYPLHGIAAARTPAVSGVDLTTDPVAALFSAASAQ
jgi:hypothetical protein